MRTAEAIQLQYQIATGAEIVVSSLQKASKDDPFMAVAIAALAACAIASASGVSKERLLEAIEIAWEQSEPLRD